jgi:cytochrome c oxidase cbb3-type subunit III
MPSFRLLGASRIQALVLYLRSLQGRGEARKLPGNPVADKVLFFGKAGCADCHMVSGAGGVIGSDLSNYAATEMSGEQLTGVARNEDNFSLQLKTLDGAFHLFTKTDLKSVEHQDRSLMPSDYGSRLSHAELDDVVSYLMSVAKTNLAGAKPGHKAKKPQTDDEE